MSWCTGYACDVVSVRTHARVQPSRKPFIYFCFPLIKIQPCFLWSPGIFNEYLVTNQLKCSWEFFLSVYLREKQIIWVVKGSRAISSQYIIVLIK